METTKDAEARTAAEQLFRSGFAALLREDVEGFVDMWAEGGSIDFPYAPPGLPKRLEGKPAIREHVRSLLKILRFERLSEPVFHPTLDPSTLIVEFSCEGHALPTGRPYPQRYISVIELREGRIFGYRDYWNPLVVQRAMGPQEARS